MNNHKYQHQVDIFTQKSERLDRHIFYVKAYLIKSKKCLIIFIKTYT